MARSPTPPAKDELVAVWFALGLLFALFVGTAAGILWWRSGQSVAAAALTGGASFGGTVSLVVLVIKLLRR